MEYKRIHLNDFFPALKKTDEDAVLEYYLPEKVLIPEHNKRPCVLICPGGGYTGCSRREAEPIALQFLPESYNVFILTYSVAPHRFPQQLLEVAAALELIHQKADEWGCDSTKVAICGFSAGGHLAAHYSTCYDCDAVRAVFPNSKPVQASVLGYPVITADARYAHMGSFEGLIGHTPESLEEIAFFSCDQQVSATTPPAFIWHTSEDEVVPVMNSLLYAAALTRHNVPVELHIYPSGWHGLSTLDNQTCGPLSDPVFRARRWLDEVKGWLRSTL